MPRYKLTLEYDGTGLTGWQRQDNGRSVQQALEEAAEKLGGHPVRAYAAGRTDAGVHALAQVAHIELEKAFPAERVREAINFHLKGRPEIVAVVAAEQVSDDFHARFSAIERSYLYRILNRRPPPTVDRGRVWWVGRPLDADAMHAAAQRLIGTHDFTSFRAAECQAKSPIKTLDQLDVFRQGDEIHLIVRARSFLHHQVRIFAGTLRLVGEGKWNGDDLARILEARNRAAAGDTAPPYGLYLTSARYPSD